MPSTPKEKANDPGLMPPSPPVQALRDVAPETWEIPSRERCEAICRKYGTPDHIWDHSRQVAKVAVWLARLAREKGVDVNVDAVRASALLHDVAKMYTIDNGGHHGQLGAAWVVAEVGNPAVALGVAHHVYWPFELDLDAYFMPMAVCYSDKRVMHDKLVTIEDRFTDLKDRYGKTSLIRARIDVTRREGLAMQKMFEQRLGVELDACTFDSGRLV